MRTDDLLGGARINPWRRLTIIQPLVLLDQESAPLILDLLANEALEIVLLRLRQIVLIFEQLALPVELHQQIIVQMLLLNVLYVIKLRLAVGFVKLGR